MPFARSVSAFPIPVPVGTRLNTLPSFKTSGSFVKYRKIHDKHSQVWIEEKEMKNPSNKKGLYGKRRLVSLQKMVDSEAEENATHHSCSLLLTTGTPRHEDGLDYDHRIVYAYWRHEPVLAMYLCPLFSHTGSSYQEQTPLFTPDTRGFQQAPASARFTTFIFTPPSHKVKDSQRFSQYSDHPPSTVPVIHNQVPTTARMATSPIARYWQN